jgi:UDP-3-O-[3-hydroxymyristoyl] glucosamine N-acyltransferase
VRTTLVRVADAQGAFAKVLAMYNTIKLDKKGIAPQAVIEEGATYGKDCYIGALAYIGDQREAGQQREDLSASVHRRQRDHRRQHHGLRQREDLFGLRGGQANCIIHSGTVIGSDGFRFATGPMRRRRSRRSATW